MIDIEVTCECGQNYIFEVEPINNRMPTSVSCPSCGSDGTALANQQISNAFNTLDPIPQSLYKSPSLPASLAAYPPPIPTASGVSGTAKASLICGIVAIAGSFLAIPLLAAIPAIITGHLALSSIKKSNGVISGRRKAIWGTILGYIGCALFLFLIIFGAVTAPTPQYVRESDYRRSNNGGEYSRTNSNLGEITSQWTGTNRSPTGADMILRETWHFHKGGRMVWFCTPINESGGSQIEVSEQGYYQIVKDRWIQIHFDNGNDRELEFVGDNQIRGSSDESRYFRTQ
ncbi:MAG: DUF4190 domain-containing protein [Akkermansiaceae bacterium]|nr:DUF4190 domain-containing protein [Akkermansiaceae bacterium]